MQTFNDSLSIFLVDCRENALDELKQDARYEEMANKRNKLLEQIAELLTPEGKALFEEYRESVGEMLSLPLSVSSQFRNSAISVSLKCFSDIFSGVIFLWSRQ